MLCLGTFCVLKAICSLVWSCANDFLKEETQRLRNQGIVLTLSVINSLAGHVFLSVTIRNNKITKVD